VETESLDMHISDFLDSLSSSAPGKDDDSVNHAGLNGIGMPSCSQCPDPSYSDFPRAGRVQGVAVFQVVISADGTAERLYPMKLIGYGLDENAYNTIKQWRFKPARDKSGVAVPCIVAAKTRYAEERLYRWLLKVAERLTTLYPLFFSSANTSLATSFSVSNTPCPVTATPSSTGSPFFCSCFFNSSTGSTFGKSRLFSCST
jgi:hypothetical protein